MPICDTPPKIERIQIELLRKMPPWRKMEIVGQMNEMVRALAMAGLRQRYPQDSPARLQRRLADLLLGPELAAKVYGPLVEESDLRSKLGTQAERLDLEHIRRLADELVMSDLLAHAREESANWR